MKTLTYLIVILDIIIIVGIIAALIIRGISRSRARKAEEKKFENISDRDEELTGLEKIAREKGERKYEKRGLRYYIEYVLSITYLGIGKLWEWWFTPKKVLVTLIIAFIAVVILIYYLVSTVSGEIVVNVRELSTQIPPKKIDSINVFIEAHDRITNSLVPDIKFTTKDKSIKKQETNVPLLTNKDGIAYVKYKGRFNPKDIVLQIKVSTQGTKQEGKYHEVTLRDTSLRPVHTVNIRPRPTRPVIYGVMPIFASIKDLIISRGEIPPITFALEIYPVNVEGKNTQDGKFFLKTDSTAKDSIELQWHGSVFKITEQKLREQPYYLTYAIEDSSRFTTKMIIEPEGVSKFKFDNAPEPFLVSVGGQPPQPQMPKVSSTRFDNTVYSFAILNEAGDMMKNIYVYIKASDEERDQAVIKTSNERGEIKYPDAPIEKADLFWKDSTGADINYEIWMYNPDQKPPRDRSRNVLKWEKPKIPAQSTLFKIEFNQETMQIKFIQ